MIRKPSTNDIVTYDSVTTWGNEPHAYRSERLYRDDQRASLAVKPGESVQVIKEHGDSLWTNATMVKWESIPGDDMGQVRFWVTLADGTAHMVSSDRIRPDYRA